MRKVAADRREGGGGAAGQKAQAINHVALLACLLPGSWGSGFAVLWLRLPGACRGSSAMERNGASGDGMNDEENVMAIVSLSPLPIRSSHCAPSLPLNCFDFCSPAQGSADLQHPGAIRPCSRILDPFVLPSGCLPFAARIEISMPTGGTQGKDEAGRENLTSLLYTVPEVSYRRFVSSAVESESRENLATGLRIENREMQGNLRHNPGTDGASDSHMYKTLDRASQPSIELVRENPVKFQTRSRPSPAISRNISLLLDCLDDGRACICQDSTVEFRLLMPRGSGAPLQFETAQNTTLVGLSEMLSHP
ncbi:hypothetical protein N658DRAFT_5095 [Parathielavia hyrcaniae]|uniref:Uncharacterized protein n=1 Tax=Parathielavia hyrcaniae TaxID=113614 RepID=A0AAN6T5L4_9PEZI|nr:hypothetical protein N658DRAFT_5095 [Parathielavia hyrcaniae]